MTGYESKRAAARDKLAQPAQEPWPKEPFGHMAGGVQPAQEPVATLFGTLPVYDNTPPQRTEQCNYPDCKCPTENPCLKGLVQPEEEKLHPISIGVDVTQAGTSVTAFYRKPDAVMEMFYAQFHPMPQPTQEPVAYMSHNKENFVSADDVGNSVPNWTDYYPTPLYTTPPQPAQEPVAHLCGPDENGLFGLPTADKACKDCFPVYTTPPQRTWVGLTNDEVNNLAAGCHLGNSVQDAIYKAVAKLKEKNNAA